MSPEAALRGTKKLRTERSGTDQKSFISANGVEWSTDVRRIDHCTEQTRKNGRGQCLGHAYLQCLPVGKIGLVQGKRHRGHAMTDDGRRHHGNHRATATHVNRRSRVEPGTSRGPNIYRFADRNGTRSDDERAGTKPRER